jgi:protein-serine/threonine kinase
MVLEYCAGGELFFHLSRAGRFSESRCKFYSSELTLAIGYLHSLNIIYRDLKPENILISGEGHAKITDFGLSKEGIMDNISAKTMCGTPEYLAPEILLKVGHGRAVDWYSLGALVYEMLTGLPPFYTKNRDALFQNIKNGTLTYPPYIVPNAVTFMQSMMCRDPSKRLGGGATDVDEVKRHPFFAEVNWVAVIECKLPVPFKPTLSAAGDVKYFDKEFVNLAVADSETGQRSEVRHFEGFTYDGKS